MKTGIVVMVLVGFLFLIIGAAGQSMSAPGVPDEGAGGLIIIPVFVFMGYLIWQGLKSGW